MQSSPDIDFVKHAYLGEPLPQIDSFCTGTSCRVCALGRRRGLAFLGTFEVISQSARRGCHACAGILSFLELERQMQWSDQKEIYKEDLWQHCRITKEDLVIYEYFTKTTLDASSTGSKPIPIGKDPSRGTWSEQGLDTLRDWIHQCEANHKLCTRASSPLPHRVLKILSMEPMIIRVAENDPSMAKYVCLSYRWAQETAKTCLTKANLEVYRNAIPDECVYPLVRDAISVAWKLGFTYVWIDAYCIIQDSELDWKHEAALMGDIYENAFFTISATSARDGGGLFSDLSTLNTGHKITELQQTPVFIRRCLPHPRRLVKDYSGKKKKDISFLPRNPTYSILSRGWIFQERILSRRFVHFLAGELFWECRESVWCECRSQEEDWREYRISTPRVLDDIDWSSLIEDYVHTKFTFENDRLQAVSGVARRYAAAHGKTYLAGMWFEDLPHTFLWKHTSANSDPRPLRLSAPSWSWVFLSAQDALPPGTFSLNSGYYCDLDFLGYTRNPPVDDIYAGHHSVSLTIAGPMIMGTISPRDNWVRACGLFWTLEPDFDMQPEKTAGFQVVQEGSDVLLLVCGTDTVSGHCHMLVLQAVCTPLDGSGQHHGDTFQRIGRLSVKVSELSSPRNYLAYALNWYDLSSKDKDQPNAVFTKAQALISEEAVRRTITLV